MGNHAGSKSILEVIRRRRVLAHIHGHIHESFGREQIHFNVSSVGMVINLANLSSEVIDTI